jgi:hypothetical protein
MPPKTRSSTGAIKKVVKYEDSIDSASADVEMKPTKRRMRAKSESGSDYGTSEASSSESETSSVVAAHVSHSADEDDIDTVSEVTVDSSNSISLPVIRRGKNDPSAVKEGRLPMYPDRWLSLTQDELTHSVLSEVQLIGEAIAEVEYLSGRFRELCDRPNISDPDKISLLKEMANILLHRIGNAGVARARDYRDFSFASKNEIDVRNHFSKLQYVASCLLTGDLKLEDTGMTESTFSVEPYSPAWIDS